MNRNHRNTALGLVAATALMANTAMAGEPLKLTDTQMDDVTAGNFRQEIRSANAFGHIYPSWFEIVGTGTGMIDGYAESSAVDTGDSLSARARVGVFGNIVSIDGFGYGQFGGAEAYSVVNRSQTQQPVVVAPTSALTS